MKIKVNELYILDPYNKLKQKRNGILVVQVIAIHKKLFNPTLVDCICVTSGIPIRVKKDLLYKYNSRENVNVTVRSDNCCPIITNDDMCALLKAATELKDPQLCILFNKLGYYSSIEYIERLYNDEEEYYDE